MAGIIVTSIDPASAAYRAGLREDDLIRSVNRRSVQDAQDFYAVVEQMADGSSVMLGVFRDGSGFFIAFAM